MENKINKNIWIWVLVGVIIIGFALFYIFRNREVVPEAVVVPIDSVAIEPESTLDTNNADSTSVGAVSISYANALVKYANRRIQFNASCQVPILSTSVTYKDNTGIMLDNRSAVAHTIKIGTNYTVKAYGFRIVVLPDTYLKAKTILVDCDKQQNVATILVQE